MNSEHFNFSVIAAGLIWVPVCIAVMTLIGWIIQAEIDATAGALGIALSVGIGAVAFISPDPATAPSLLLAAISMLVLFPVGRSFREKREMALLDLEQMERAYEMLAKNQNDVGAKLKIAKMLQRRGNTGNAVEVAEAALKGMPHDLFTEELRMIAMWKRTGFFHTLPVVCVTCLARNQGGSVFCYRCGAPVMLHFAKGQWVHPALMRRLLLGWMACVIPIIGIPVAATNLPPAKSGPIVVVLLCVAGLIGWLALKGWRSATA